MIPSKQTLKPCDFDQKKVTHIAMATFYCHILG